MALNNTNIKKLFYAFLLTHLVVWTVIPAVTNNNLPLDTIEALAWGSNLDWGFNKHPPMSAAMVEIIYLIFGSDDWAYYLLSQICIVLTFFVVYKLSEEFLKNKLLCLISVLLLEGIYFYNFTTPEFNVNVCLIPFWSLSVYYFWYGITYNRISDWFLLGVFAGFGFLSKYLFIYLGLVIDLYLIYKIIKKEINLNCLISLLPFLLIVSPHLIWLTENDYSTIKYGLKRSGSIDQSSLNHLIQPVTFFIKQIGILIPLFIMTFFLNSKFKIKKNIKDNKFIFLLIINFVPLVLVFLTSIILGSKIRTMWMTPFYIFLGLFIVYVFQASINKNKLKSFVVTFFIFFIFSPFAYSYVSISKTDKRTDYQGKKIAKIIDKEWKEYSKGEFKLQAVIGDEWVAGNLSYHIKSRPKWYSFSQNPGKLKGGLIIANHPDINCDNEFIAVFKVVKLNLEGNPCFVMFKNRD